MNFNELEMYAHFMHVPIVRPKTKELVLQYVAEVNPKQILEIGTAIGYSGSLMLEKSSNATLTTIEKSGTMVQKAKVVFENFNLDSRVSLISGDANLVLETLSQQGQKYDFIFLDGPKSQYLTQLPFLLEMLSPKGVIAVDNVLFMGQVLSDEYPNHKHRTTILKLRKFLQSVFDNKQLDSKLYQIEDGLLIIRFSTKF